MPLDKEERVRRSLNYKEFDRVLTETHGGDLIEMYEWAMDYDNSQFETKFIHDQFITDFHRWMRNRGIGLSDN